MVRMEEEETAFDKIRTINNSHCDDALYTYLSNGSYRFLPTSTWRRYRAHWGKEKGTSRRVVENLWQSIRLPLIDH